MPETIQPAALAIIVVFTVASTVFVALRVGIRAHTNQFKTGKIYGDWSEGQANILPDDLLCLVAWILSTANGGVLYRYVQVSYIGYHVWDIPKASVDETVYEFKLSMAQQLLYNPILCLVKASLILFLLRLNSQYKLTRYSLKALFVFNLGHMVATFFGALTQCLPIHMYWDRFKTDRVVDGQVMYSCFNAEAFSMSTASIAILTDILILIFPIVMVWPLRMNRRKKIAVAGVLSLGWSVVIIGIIRLKYFYDFFHVSASDPSYSVSVTVSTIEINVAIIASCGPAMNAIVNRFAPRFFGSRSSPPPTTSFAHDVPPEDYDLPSRTPRKFYVPSITSSRNTSRPYRAREDDGEGLDSIVDNDSLGSKRADIIRAMIDTDKGGRGLYVR